MEAREVVVLETNEKIAEFQSGDTVKVNVWIVEGERRRQQSFQGVVMRTRKGGPSSSFTVRRVASGIGVERSFFYHSPNVDSVEVIRRGIVRRNNLTYLRGLSGKNARIKERTQSGKR
jgi:large subunit ribosomal protein L19